MRFTSTGYALQFTGIICYPSAIIILFLNWLPVKKVNYYIDCLYKMIAAVCYNISITFLCVIKSNKSRFEKSLCRIYIGTARRTSIIL